MKKIILLIILISMCNKINAYTEYKIGDKVTYNDIEFYVIQDSDVKENSVTMLKAEPLSYEEIQKYIEGIDVQITNQNGYGGVAYYVSETCGFLNGHPKFDGCTTNYNTSIIKMVVDAWANEKVTSGLQDARLLSIEDLLTNLGYDENKTSTGEGLEVMENVPIWLYNPDYYYWTMSSFHDSSMIVWSVRRDGSLGGENLYNNSVLRPVITISKTALGDTDESIIVEKDNETKANDNVTTKTKDNNTITKVNVPNTYLTSSIIIIISGLILAVCGIVLYYIKTKNKE